MFCITDELIKSMLKSDPQAYKHAREIAARNLRGHQYARTNQFDITARFAGLDEKFRVKNRDDLADALQTRLQKLEGYKYQPDVLSLLLQLADRPLENTHVEALELLRPASPPPPLTWAEILQEDPYSDDEIWKDIDYGEDSSGDEKLPKRKDKVHISPATFDIDDAYDPESCTVSTDETLVTKLEETKFWKVADEKKAEVPITELQAVRETLFMLGGLQTSLYRMKSWTHGTSLCTKYVIHNTPSTATIHLLSQFMEIGNRLNDLREWALQKETASRPIPRSPLHQTFVAAVRTRLLQFDCCLSQQQQKYLQPENAVPVSLMQLHNDVRAMSTPILSLDSIRKRVELDQHVLEALFEQITLAQMTLDDGLFKYTSDVFFECLETFLKPIRRWMETGELASNDDTLPLFVNDTHSDAASLWHDRYVLSLGGRDHLLSPSFLRPVAEKVFIAGKSVVFLKELSIYDTNSHASGQEPSLQHDTSAFETWISSKYSIASTVLRQHILETDGLMQVLNNFEILYLGKNGAVFEDFATAIIERMESGRRGWNDRYVLTELARGIFGTILTAATAERVVVRATKAKAQGKSVKDLAAISIDYARSSVPIYQEICTFLMQIYRVKHALQRARVRPSRKAKPLAFYGSLHRLMWFADVLRSYTTETAIFLSTRDMSAAMEKAEDVDEMAQIHVEYMKRLHQRALLSKELKPIHNAIIELLDLGVLFAQTKGSVSQQVNQEVDRLLPFIIAGLRSVGRAGAEPMWEQLADRLS
ncbi:gamma-tubulin complex component GCP5 [Pyrenophora seminiperda CCB06]|uniref:Spindle pole body component n=1 Tax=Pyrenophora seminiperda CCB06 TaxID=1302712 RepID=A0A3M7M176_9PLEO|nr:gamma-tubulin complex component GCP5 [Pyrenophora seminiperda CCB06]